MCTHVSLVMGEIKCRGVYTCFPGDGGDEMSGCVHMFPW